VVTDDTSVWERHSLITSLFYFIYMHYYEQVSHAQFLNITRDHVIETLSKKSGLQLKVCSSLRHQEVYFFDE
jgi:hypothetical protein